MNFTAALLLIVGYFLVVDGDRKKAGFIAQMAGTTYYTIAYLGSDLSIVLVNVIFFGVNAYGLLKEYPALLIRLREQIDDYRDEYYD